MKKNALYFSLMAVYILLTLIVSACSQTGDSLFHGALGLGDTRVVLASSSGTTTHNHTLYDGEGKFVSLLSDYVISGGTPRGMSYFSALCFLAAIEGLDQIEKICIDGSSSTVWGKSTLVIGYNGILTLPDGRVLATDANTIEMFDANGIRVPPTGATPYINTTVGGCVLNAPTRMTLNSNDQLVVTSPGNERVLIYNISTSVPTCVTSTNFGAFANDPQAVLAHSNGSLYIATIVNTNETIWRADSQGANATAIFQNQAALMVDANALAELPNGNILISSLGTDAIIEIDSDGNFVRTFAKDSNTLDVQDIYIISGEAQ